MLKIVLQQNLPISDMVSLVKITWPSPAETDFHRRVENTIYALPDFLKYKLSTKLTRVQHAPATAPGKGLVFPSQNKEK
jgi:hypothetical protein